MDILEWLRRYAPGFGQIGTEELDAIMHFPFLWSLFEFKALCTHASAQAIVDCAKKFEDNDLLDGRLFEHEFFYFKRRFINEDGSITSRFESLHFRKKDRQDLVRDALNGKGGELEIVAALLIIVFRLRNNFFHGSKWGYDFEEQTKNFRFANSILMKALDIQKEMENKEIESSGSVE